MAEGERRREVFLGLGGSFDDFLWVDVGAFSKDNFKPLTFAERV